MSLRNISKHLTDVAVSGPALDFKLKITDEHGDEVTLSAKGQALFENAFLAPGVPRRADYREVTLSPSDATEATWDITDIYAFSRPGSYRISATTKLYPSAPAGATISSNVLEVDLQ